MQNVKILLLPRIPISISRKILPKRRFIISQSSSFQKTAFFMVTAVKTSIPTKFFTSLRRIVVYYTIIRFVTDDCGVSPTHPVSTEQNPESECSIFAHGTWSPILTFLVAREWPLCVCVVISYFPSVALPSHHTLTIMTIPSLHIIGNVTDLFGEALNSIM
jgi:hypothetical protein